MRRVFARLVLMVTLVFPVIPALAQRVEPGAATEYSWILPSVARYIGGAGGSLWTTLITVANPSSEVGVTVFFQFLGHDQDGRGSAAIGYALRPGESATIDGLLERFNIPEGFGAVRVTATSPHLIIQSETSTFLMWSYGGTVGQFVPALGPSDLAGATPKTLVPIHEYEEPWAPPQPGPKNSFRTNVVLVNAVEVPVSAHVALFARDGTLLGSRDVILPPLGMTQIGRVASFVGAGPVYGARLAISTPTPGGLVAAYASVIDNISNDPRTVLPR